MGKFLGFLVLFPWINLVWVGLFVHIYHRTKNKLAFYNSLMWIAIIIGDMIFLEVYKIQETVYPKVPVMILIPASVIGVAFFVSFLTWMHLRSIENTKKFNAALKHFG